MNKLYTIKGLPKTYFGREYAIFSFDVLNGYEPIALHIGTYSDDIVTITDLDKLNGYFEGETYYEDHTSYGLFVRFLQSITLKLYDATIIPMHHDIKYVEDHFYVKLKTV